MKILVYTDLHCSYTSSIMPLYYKDSKYTTRLQMIIDTGKWLNKVATLGKVDMIINGGDTTDSHILRSEEITALSEFFRAIQYDCRHIIITGNHDTFDNNVNFYSTSILSNINNIEVYNKPTKINDELSVLPYASTENISLDTLKSISNKVLLSHIDIKGSHLRSDYIMDTGIDPEILAEYFNLVLNGHLHTAEEIITSKNKIHNIGGISSISFSDSNSYIPSACIIDTETLKIDRYENPFAILFRRLTVNSIEDLLNKIKKFTTKHKYILRVNSPYNIRDEVREILSNKSNVITYRVVSNMIDKRISLSDTNKLDLVDDIESEFINYLKNNTDSLNYPLGKYLEVLGNLGKK